VSTTRRIEIFSRRGMTGKGLRKHINQPIAGLALLAFCAVAVPTPAQAQVPTFSPLAPPPVNSLPPSGVPSRINNFPATPAPAARVIPNRLPPETPYTLGPGDRLKIDVFDVPEYSGEFTVLVDGTLNLPILGRVSVQGRTLEGATGLLSNTSTGYGRFVKRPLVTVSLIAARPITLAVAGEVNRPGTYTVTPGGGGNGPNATTGQFPTVTQVITLAGGITQAAAVSNVVIRRRSLATGQIEDYSVNLLSLLRNGDISQDVRLRDGDTVRIPTVDAVDPNETRQLADASFASKEVRPINVAVVGEVGRPGPYSITGGGAATGGATGAVTGSETGVAAGGTTGGPPTVTKAIQVAGGITALADVRSITIQRTSRTGKIPPIRVNLWELLRAGDVSQDVILQEGDIITIPTATAYDPSEATQLAGASFAPNTIVVNVVGEVTRPGAIPVPPNTPLNQAVLAAGGYNVRARKRSVDLIRLNPNGSVEKRAIEVDLAQGINEAGNPTLRNNDVVVVRRSTLATIGDTLGTVLNPVGSFLNIFSIFRTLGGN